MDKELEKLEEEAQKPYKPYNPYEDSKNNLRAKPKTKINVKGRRNIISDPTDLKDKVPFDIISGQSPFSKSGIR